MNGGFSICNMHWKLAIAQTWQVSLVAQLVKNLPAMQETPVRFLGQEDSLERDRLPTPVFLGFPSGSAGKESACNAGDLGSVSAGKIPWRRERLSTPGFWLGEFHGLHSLWGRRESDTTEWLSLHFTSLHMLHGFMEWEIMKPVLLFVIGYITCVM